MKKNTRTIAVIAAAAALVTGLAACGTSAADNTGVVVESAEPTATPTQEPTATPTQETPKEPLAAGTDTTVGDWNIKITEAVKNANALVHGYNPYNDAPTGQYVAITVSAVYNGTGTGSLNGYLEFQFVGTDGVVYDEASVVDQSDSEDWPDEARAGGSLKDQYIFDVPASAIDGGLVVVSDWVSDDEVEFLIP